MASNALGLADWFNASRQVLGKKELLQSLDESRILTGFKGMPAGNGLKNNGSEATGFRAFHAASTMEMKGFRGRNGSNAPALES